MRRKKELYQNKVRELERRIDAETYDYTEKRRLMKELEKLKRERPTERELFQQMMEEDRAREEERKRTIARVKSARLVGGSRFNIRYQSRLTDADKTPESVMEALSEYLDFPFTKEERPATADDADAP